MIRNRLPGKHAKEDSDYSQLSEGDDELDGLFVKLHELDIIRE